MTAPDQIVCVILAGGQGKRMASKGRHKVCFPIAGRPAIVRAIDTYKAAGLKRFLVVVGQLAEQVIPTVTQAHPEVTFVYQTEPRGTGHAAIVAADALAAEGYDGAAMVVMGDKVTRPSVVRALLERFTETHADVVLSTFPKEPASTSGRVVMDSAGHVLGVVELADILRARRTGRKINLAGRPLSAAQLEGRSSSLNASMYLFRFPSLHWALQQIDSDNAQGELYLTDTVEHLARTGRAEAMLVSEPTDLMGFNTPAEMLAIEQAVRKRERPSRVSVAAKRLSPRTFKPAGEWLRILQAEAPELRRALRRCYGREESLLAERRKQMARLVGAFARRFGQDRRMILCRAPGRVNLMGRHVDHRGGFVNVMAISREVLLAAAPRDDDAVTLRNLDERRFPPRSFRIFDLLREASWSDWMDFLDSRAAQRALDSARGDWSHYARAPLLRLQHECREVRLKGMDCLLSGNIPMGAGLSSSSALVVAFAEAAVALNGLRVAMRDFLDLCGEGEWFVGSRGGSADHAAIRTGRAGYVSRIGFFPFRMAGEVRLPSALRVVIAHSGSQAVKSGAARDVFNQRVACYELALMLLRGLWPPAAGVEHLRDLAPGYLKVKPGEIYRALMRLPVRPARSRLRKMVPPELRDRAEEVFAAHGSVGAYDLRGVTLYGIGECLRSERFAQALASGDLRQVGQFMRISHDGDRLVRFDAAGRPRRHIVRTDDASLQRLAAADAELSAQPGRYACSTEAIDQLVDVACATEGVVGAQLAGAGLGGCMMILVRHDALSALMRRLRRQFYRPRRLAFDAHVCVPVAGAGLLRL